MPDILIVKTSSMGDLVHTLPMVTDIVRNVPGARIDWVVEEAFAEIPALHPAVDRRIQVAVRRWRKTPFARAVWEALAQLRQALRARDYDFIIDAQGLLKSAIIAKLARGPVHGRDRASIREPLATAFYTRTHAVPKGRHAVWRNRTLAAQVFGYTFDAATVDYGMQPPTGLPIPNDAARYVVCVHGCSDPKRWWHTDKWGTLGRALHAQGYGVLLPWGNAAERRNAEVIAKLAPGAAVLPQLSLTDQARVLNGAAAVVGVDTGLLHLANGLRKPTVAIFTYTEPGLSGAMGAATPWAINVGGIGLQPSVDEVFAALRTRGVDVGQV